MNKNAGKLQSKKVNTLKSDFPMRNVIIPIEQDPIVSEISRKLKLSYEFMLFYAPNDRIDIFYNFIWW